MGGKEEEGGGGGTWDGAPGAGEAGGRERGHGGRAGAVPGAGPSGGGAGLGEQRGSSRLWSAEWGSLRHEAQHCHFTQRRGRLPNPERSAPRPGREPSPPSQRRSGPAPAAGGSARRRLPHAKPAADPRSRERPASPRAALGRRGAAGRGWERERVNGGGGEQRPGLSYLAGALPGAARRRPPAGALRGSGGGAGPRRREPAAGFRPGDGPWVTEAPLLCP